GVNLSNCAKIVQAGADVIVAGSAVFNSENRKDAIQQLKMG
ncbi:MAG: ribulose-phosphate 3-epimerase, partial [Clostridia bacterium]|nr:ribulose-phosphate 3-epimerase [Clostridia bacterium]